MDKKVKWSIIAVSTATTLGFGGLVYQNSSGTTNNTAATVNNESQDNSSQLNENTDQTERFSRGNHQGRNGVEGFSASSDDSFNQDSSDESSSWGQDQFQQAPSTGFEQGNGSSGATR
jgi:hypothetical protein